MALCPYQCWWVGSRNSWRAGGGPQGAIRVVRAILSWCRGRPEGAGPRPNGGWSCDQLSLLIKPELAPGLLCLPTQLGDAPGNRVLGLSSPSPTFGERRQRPGRGHGGQAPWPVAGTTRVLWPHACASEWLRVLGWARPAVAGFTEDAKCSLPLSPLFPRIMFREHLFLL